MMLGLGYLHSNNQIHGTLSIDKIFAADRDINTFDIDVFISDIGFGSKTKNIKPDNIMCMSPELVMRDICTC